ncbi:MAG: hypothetical protein V1921_03160 [Candidatus Altiarchaeota archaeon]
MKSKIIIDATVPISLSKVNYFDEIKKFIEEEKCELIMSKQTFDECCQRDLKRELQNIGGFKTIESMKPDIEQLRTLHETKFGKHPCISDNDYSVIDISLKEKGDIIVTDDYNVLKVLQNIKNIKKIPQEQGIIATLPTFLLYMYRKNKRLFNRRLYICMNCDIYKNIEIPYTHEGVKDKEWSVRDIRYRFRPYAESITGVLQK